MRSSLAIAEHDRGMDEERGGEPADVTVQMLGETQQIQREDDTL